MLVVGLVHDHGWRPPDDAPDRGPRRSWHLPWRPLAWFAVWCWLLALVPVADNLIGPVAGYVVLLLAVALIFWRVERWCTRQYWRGLHDYQA